ncbi:hypothetical protein EVAR_70393_1 [Eumeta japonica]|uniref:Uncharacterized protein n=1 Tax=Eumeta variegata TaxID=151549 RepID=A0A4C2AD02_EUMVA|nr:hypothetical protein EVAR_70393_1 [Eumeta japonica]
MQLLQELEKKSMKLQLKTKDIKESKKQTRAIKVCNVLQQQEYPFPCMHMGQLWSAFNLLRIKKTSVGNWRPSLQKRECLWLCQGLFFDSYQRIKLVLGWLLAAG